MDVAAWLRAIGLAQYEQAFREHAIDMDVLPALDDAHLRELGVPLGDRPRLLKAISRLGEAAGAAPTTEARGEEIPPAAAAAPDGELRQVTVMFADLVGFTSLSNAVDAEDEVEKEGVVPSGAQEFSSQRGLGVWVSTGDVECEASEHGEVGRPVVLAVARAVFVEADVEGPVQAVLDVPMGAHDVEQAGGREVIARDEVLGMTSP